MFGSRLIAGIVAATAAFSFGCSAEASLPPDFITPTVSINSERVPHSSLEEDWGPIVRWRLQDADWSIELPESGRWSSVDPFNESGYSPDSVLYTTDVASNRASGASMRLELHRHDTSSLSRPYCAAPTVFNWDGSMASRELSPLEIQGRIASVARITPAATGGSHTGTVQVCLVSGDSVYVVSISGRPAAVQPVLLQFVQTLELN